jgi:heme/copper-type cytochrome/quinol oxidase subunit 1
MSAVSASPAVSSAPSNSAVGAIGAWLTTTDHKRIGRLFIGLSVIWLLGVSAVATVLGFERISDASNTFDANAVPQLFAFTRVGLMFGVALPILMGLAIAVVPIQIGARAIALARVASLGFWAWAAGSAMVIASIIGNGGPGGGNADLVDVYLLGFGLGLVGLLAAAVSLCTTVMTARCSGMSLDRIPMMSWSALVSAVSVLLTVPVALGSVIYVAVDHHYGRIVLGGNK